jgi:uncharacterized membrane protein YdbT with pleckstrin-like domain
MEPTELKRNPDAFKIQAYFILVAAFFVGLLAAFIFGRMVHFMVGSYNGSRILALLTVLLVACISILLSYSKWRNEEYVLTDEGIIISTSLTITKRKKKLYLYESIISASFSQSYLGSKFGYGEIHITMPKLGEKLIMKDVASPELQLNKLQKFISQKTGKNNLVT